MNSYTLAHSEISPHGYKLPKDAYIVTTVGYVKDNEEVGHIEMRMVLPHDIVLVAVRVTAEVKDVH